MTIPDASLARAFARPGGFAPSPAEMAEEQEKFAMLTSDARNHELADADYQAFVDEQAQRLVDFETGASRRKVDGVFRPKPAVEHTDIFESVGVGEANHPADVARTKDAITALGLGGFDRTMERSTDATPGFFNALEASQRRLGVTVDGVMRPGGETNTAMKGAMARKVGGSAGMAGEAASRIALGMTPSARAGDGEPSYSGVGGEGASGIEPIGATPAVASGAGPRAVPALTSEKNDLRVTPAASTGLTEVIPARRGSSRRKRAIILDTPDGPYLLLKKAPRQNKFVPIESGKRTTVLRITPDQAAEHYLSLDIPLAPAEARSIKERLKRGESIHGTMWFRAKHLVRRGQPVFIVYPGGQMAELTDKQGRRLMAPGEQPYYLDAAEAWRLGLGDWGMVPPPDHIPVQPAPPSAKPPAPLSKNKFPKYGRFRAPLSVEQMEWLAYSLKWLKYSQEVAKRRHSLEYWDPFFGIR